MTLTIGKLAQRAGVGIETVRFYERKGLLREPARSESGYRQYPEAVVSRLHFIKQGQRLGFSLKQVAELLALRVDESATCEDVKIRAEAKIIEVEGKILELERIRKALGKLSVSCTGHGPTSECPFLEALDSTEKEDRAPDK